MSQSLDAYLILAGILFAVGALGEAGVDLLEPPEHGPRVVHGIHHVLEHRRVGPQVVEAVLGEVARHDVAAQPALAGAREKLYGGAYALTDESGDAHLFTQQLAATEPWIFGIEPTDLEAFLTASGLAWMGRRPSLLEAGWLAYPVLGLTVVTMVLVLVPGVGRMAGYLKLGDDGYPVRDASGKYVRNIELNDEEIAALVAYLHSLK